jgi:hypothetical protein
VSSVAPIYSFRGEVNVAARTVTIFDSASPATSIQPQYGRLPEGPGANQVTAHTVPGSVIYDTSNTAGCGGTASAPRLCGAVEIRNGYSVTISETNAEMISIVPNTVSAVGAPYLYPDVPPNSTSASVEWVFAVPGGTNFSFVGGIWGTVSESDGGTDGGEDSGSSGNDAGDAATPCGVCSEPFPYCDTSTSQCVVCVDSTQCPSGYSCQANVCRFINNDYGYCGEEECEAELPYCDTVNMECVECLYAWHCELIGKDFCEGNICVNPKN